MILLEQQYVFYKCLTNSDIQGKEKKHANNEADFQFTVDYVTTVSDRYKAKFICWRTGMKCYFVMFLNTISKDLAMNFSIT